MGIYGFVKLNYSLSNNTSDFVETENKGDAAIWTAQQMLLSTLGITTLHSCRYVNLPFFFVVLHYFKIAMRFRFLFHSHNRILWKLH